MNNYELLTSYQPEYYQGFVEMQEILKAQGEVFDDLSSILDDIENNAFLIGINEVGISRYEKILGERVSSNSSLDERKFQIYSKMIFQGKISGSTIEKLARSYTQEDVRVIFEDSKIKLMYNDIPDKDFVQLYRELIYRIPAHLGCVISFDVVSDWRVGADETVRIYMEEKMPVYVRADNRAIVRLSYDSVGIASYIIDSIGILSLNNSFALDGSQILDGVNEEGISLYIRDVDNLSIDVYKQDKLVERDDV